MHDGSFAIARQMFGHSSQEQGPGDLEVSAARFQPHSVDLGEALLGFDQNQTRLGEAEPVPAEIGQIRPASADPHVQSLEHWY